MYVYIYVSMHVRTYMYIHMHNILYDFDMFFSFVDGFYSLVEDFEGFLGVCTYLFFIIAFRIGNA